MRTSYIFSHFLAAGISIVAASTSYVDAAHAYTAHEWGTFTSVQGGNGELLSWRPLATSELPGFVYDWNKPGLNRGKLVEAKGLMTTLQRMETPVIYFYSTQTFQVDVSVDFPKGSITEWYPQATQIGPSFAVDANGPTDTVLRESRAVWKNLSVMPTEAAAEKLQLAFDSSANHYFAARQTGANLVRTYAGKTTGAETEKFIFYRGAGSFSTPLRVSIDTNNLVTVANTGLEKLAHLFFVSIHHGQGAFALMDELPGSNSVPWLTLDTLVSEHWSRYSLAQFQTAIGPQMESALASEGLFPDEAHAMVNTWVNSWFTEEGDRVLYILPRAWTDETLPLHFTPSPETLVRVMVGRAEILSPGLIEQLRKELAQADHGDEASREHLSSDLKSLGRFSNVALGLARNGTTTKQFE